MRALVLLLLAAPLAGAAHGLRGHVAGVLDSGDHLCAAPQTGELTYGWVEDRWELSLVLARAACGVPAETRYPECLELDEPGVMWANHVMCWATVDGRAADVWLQPDGLFQAAWGDAVLEGAWASERHPRVR